MSVCRCAFKYTSEVMLRLMTPLFQSRNIATLSIVFQLISQATRINYFCGCSCRSARQSSRKVHPTANMVLEDYKVILRGNGVLSRLGWHKICFCSGWNTPETGSVGTNSLLSPQDGPSALPSLQRSVIQVQLSQCVEKSPCPQHANSLIFLHSLHNEVKLQV